MKKDFLARYIVPTVVALMLILGAAVSYASPESLGEDSKGAMAIEDTDGGITTLVQDQLQDYPHVIVETKHGVVTLSGAVFNKAEHDKVIDLVGRRGDVKGVVDNIEIRKN